ncbi:MAG TPA: hypothetical protein VFC90_03055, partial [Planctomycetota bacterium]|nr:hypothetical protein [Planctomycetota bacterium]
LGLHSALWSYGGFGSAGYPRYMVCVAPAMALIALEGWNAIADRVSAWARPARFGLAGAVLAASAAFSVIYVDAWVYSRDARLVAEVHADFLKSPRPVSRVVWSQAYMAILFDVDPWSAPAWGDRARNLEIIGGLPSGTLVFWDAETGPGWYQLKRADFERAGFQFLVSRGHEGLEGRFVKGKVLGFGGPRRQEMELLYKP